LARHDVFVLPGTMFELPGAFRISVTANDEMVGARDPGIRGRDRGGRPMSERTFALMGRASSILWSVRSHRWVLDRASQRRADPDPAHGLGSRGMTCFEAGRQGATSLRGGGDPAEVSR